MALDLSALDEVDVPAQAVAPGSPARAPLDAFLEDPSNPRFELDVDSFDALVADIRERGVLQPIVVRQLGNGKLMIRFGSRRYRAAKALCMVEAPYVVTEDERQFDDYAQISENEKRQPLQPLEFATFIERKRAAGAKKKDIAVKLGLNPSALTYLLALVQDPPSFILDLYHSRRCRSPQYLYELRKLWEARPELVERHCAEAGCIDRHLIESIIGSLELPLLEVPEKSHQGPPTKAIGREPTGGAGVEAREEESRAGPVRPVRTRGRQVQADTLARLLAPQLLATYCGRKVTLELTYSPSNSGDIVVRDGTGELWEVPIHALRLTTLCESSQ